MYRDKTIMFVSFAEIAHFSSRTYFASIHSPTVDASRFMPTFDTFMVDRSKQGPSYTQKTVPGTFQYF